MNFVSFLALLLCSSSVFGEDLILNEEKIIELVNLRNEQVQISQLDLSKSKLQIKTSTSKLFPTLSAQVGIQKASGEGNIFPNAYDWNKNANLTLSQPIYTFGRISGGLDVANSAYKISQHSKQLTISEITTVAKKIYYSILYSKELVKIFKESYLNASSNRNALKKRVQFGRISQNDNLKMKADIAGRLPALIDAKKNLTSGKLSLKNLLNIVPHKKLSILDSLQSLSLRDNPILKELNVDKLASVKLLSETVKLSDISLKLAKAQMFPILSSFARYSPSLYTDRIWGDKLREQKDLTFGLNLSFSWSLGGEQLNSVKVEKVKKRIAILRMNAQKRDELVNYHKLLQELKSLKDKLTANKNAVRLAKSSYSVMLESFKSGAISQLRLNDSEIFYTQQKISYATTLFSILNIKADLNRLVLMQRDEE